MAHRWSEPTQRCVRHPFRNRVDFAGLARVSSIEELSPIGSSGISGWISRDIRDRTPEFGMDRFQLYRKNPDGTGSDDVTDEPLSTDAWRFRNRFDKGNFEKSNIRKECSCGRVRIGGRSRQGRTLPWEGNRRSIGHTSRRKRRRRLGTAKRAFAAGFANPRDFATRRRFVRSATFP